MHPVFAVLLESAKTSKFQPVKPKRSIIRKQPLVSPLAKLKEVPKWDQPTDNCYYMSKGELCYKRNGEVIRGVSGVDRW